MLKPQTPYTNALHTLVRHPLREGKNVVNAIASRDRGIFQTGFTLRAFAPKDVSLSLSRIGYALPFKDSVRMHMALPLTTDRRVPHKAIGRGQPCVSDTPPQSAVPVDC